MPLKRGVGAVFGQIDPIGVYLTEDCSRKSAGADFGEPRSGVGAKPREVGSALFRSGRRGGVSRSGVYAAEKGAKRASAFYNQRRRRKKMRRVAVVATMSAIANA